MAILRVQHSFQGSSGKAEDQFVNVFYFTGTALDGASLLALAGAVKGFYADAPAEGSGTVIQKMATTLDNPGARVKIYNLADIVPRAPVYDVLYSPPVNSYGGANLPSEVAVCLSYAADPASGIPIARRRGRIYIGPLNVSVIEPGPANSDSHPSSSWRGDLVLAAQDMRATALASGYTWSIYSPTTGSAAAITRVWSDDAWDTQRRRGLDPTSRMSGLIG